ncbi:MAG: tetratricopeptide repeat protein [Planctomycetes bacterium]|nr:tetratricopeptide repeat protein [Planctomycetota bacterium]
MSRASVLAALVLILVALPRAFLLRPDFRPDQLPAALELPETLAPAEVLLAPRPLTGCALLSAAALLLFFWRRALGQAPAAALLPGLVLLAHPQFLTAQLAPAGQFDLAALALLLLGAYLTTVEMSTLVAAGVGLLFLAVLAAPSGAALSALAAYVLLERVPAMHKGGVLLLMYGAARALGAPALALYLPDSAALVPWPCAEDQALLQRFLQAAASLFPAEPQLLPTPGALPAALAVLALFAAALIVVPERRFGGRYAGLLGLAALALLAGAAPRGGGLGAAASAAPLVLLSLWIAGISDDVQRTLPRTLLGWALGIALLAASGLLAFTQLPAFAARRSYYAALASTAASAGGHPLERAKLRALLETAPAAEVARLAEARLGLQPGGAPAAPAADRDVALAAALSASPDLALRLLEQAERAAATDPGLLRRIRTDQLSVLVRGGLLAEALARAERFLAEAEGDARADILACRATAHACLAFRGSASEIGPVGREKESALAFEDFAAALAAAPGSARALLERGRLRLALGDGTGALKDLEECARLRPDLAAPRLELARLYFTRAQEDAGERELERARELAGAAHPEVLLVTAHLQLARGDLLGAVGSAERLQTEVGRLRGGKEELAALFALLARAAEDGSNFGLAEAMTRLALSHGADRGGDSSARLARLLRRERRFAEVVQVYEEARRRGIPVPDLQAELSQALKNAGYDHFMKGERNEARPLFLRAIQESPGFHDLGAVPSLLRSIADEARGADEEAITAEARRAFEMGSSALSRNDLAEAERLLEASIALLPQNPYAHYHLGLALGRLGRPEEAREALSAALRSAEALSEQDLASRIRDLLEQQ